MTLSPLASVADVEGWLGETLTSSESAQSDAWLRYGTAILRALKPGIDERITVGSLDPVLVTGVLVSAVVRALSAMRVGLRVRSEAYPEVSTTYADSDDSLVFFTDSDLNMLDPNIGNPGGAFSIRLG